MHDDTARALRAHTQLKTVLEQAHTLEDIETLVGHHLALYGPEQSTDREPDEEEFLKLMHALFGEFLRMGQHRDRAANICKAAACMTISLIGLVRLKGGGSTLTDLVREEVRQQAEGLLARQGRVW